jgi:hypothetical protein
METKSSGMLGAEAKFPYETNLKLNDFNMSKSA